MAKSSSLSILDGSWRPSLPRLKRRLHPFGIAPYPILRRNPRLFWRDLLCPCQYANSRRRQSANQLRQSLHLISFYRFLLSDIGTVLETWPLRCFARGALEEPMKDAPKEANLHENNASSVRLSGQVSNAFLRCHPDIASATVARRQSTRVICHLALVGGKTKKVYSIPQPVSSGKCGKCGFWKFGVHPILGMEFNGPGGRPRGP